MTGEDAAKLQGILDRLPPSDALFVSQFVETPAAIRARRLAYRNAAIRALRRHCPGPNPARAIEDALRHFIAERWSPDRGLRPISIGDGLREGLLHRVLTLNGEEGLGWRRIHDVLAEGHELQILQS